MFMATATQHQVTLDWNPTPAGQTVTFFSVKRQDTANGPFTEIGRPTTNHFVDTDPNFVEGAPYSYEVSADNPSGESGPSNIVVVTIPFRIPDAPTGLVGKPN